MDPDPFALSDEEPAVVGGGVADAAALDASVWEAFASMPSVAVESVGPGVVPGSAAATLDTAPVDAGASSALVALDAVSDGLLDLGVGSGVAAPVEIDVPVRRGRGRPPKQKVALVGPASVASSSDQAPGLAVRDLVVADAVPKALVPVSSVKDLLQESRQQGQDGSTAILPHLGGFLRGRLR